MQALIGRSMGYRLAQALLLLVSCVYFTPTARADWEPTHQIKSADDNFVLQWGGYLQADGRYYEKDPNNIDQFFLRRARPVLDAILYKNFYFRLMPDFAGGKLRLFDAYIDVMIVPEIKFRVGKFKSPIGFERLQSDATSLLFVERALPTNLVPDRDLGVQLFGDLWGGKISYVAAVLDGSPDGTSVDSDPDGYKDVAGRLFLQPFKGTSIAPLAGLGFGAGASVGTHHGNKANPQLPQYKSVSQSTFFSYAAATSTAGAAVADGTNARFSPQAYYAWGPLGIMFEQAWSSLEVSRDNIHRTVSARAWQLAVSCLVTGGKASSSGVVVERPFNWSQRHFGELELLGRYNALGIQGAFAAGLADPTSVRGADAWALGFNWYINPNVRWMADYEHTDFRSTAVARQNENAWMARLQLAF